MSHAVEVSTPDDRTIRVVRRFDAPRDLVFAAHTGMAQSYDRLDQVVSEPTP